MNSCKKVIALLGGSFDPPTIGHYLIGSECINQNLCNEVWFIPCGKRLDKINVTEPQMRLDMVNLMLQDMQTQGFPILSNDIEIKNGETIATYNLLNLLKKQYENIKFLFIIGSDLLFTLESWNNGIELKKEFDFIVYERVGYSIQNQFLPNSYQIISQVKFEISSTLIRNRIQSNQDKPHLGIQGLVSLSTIQFIKQNKLYV